MNAAQLTRLDLIRNKAGFLIDLDGCIYHGSKLLPGAAEFVAWLQRENKKFLFLTNNSAPTARELQNKFRRLGLEIDESHFYTSAMATATFLSSQKPNGSCYVIGEPGLTHTLYEAGYVMNDVAPDYVVIGEGNSHNYEKITKAVKLVMKGAKLIGTNPDVNGPDETGIAPATGAFVATVEMATGRKAFFCGKPSSLMMRYGQKILGTAVEDTVIVGDNMNTDIMAGILAQIDPVLVLSGVTSAEDLEKFAFSPYLVLNGVGDIPLVAPVTN